MYFEVTTTTNSKTQLVEGVLESSRYFQEDMGGVYSKKLESLQLELYLRQTHHGRFAGYFLIFSEYLFSKIPLGAVYHVTT